MNPATRSSRLGAAAALAAATLASVVAVACSVQEAPHADSASTAAAAQHSARTWNPDTWKPPAVDSTPDDQLMASAYRGLAILTHTRDSLPGNVGGNLNCTSCHLDEGRRPNAIPLMGVLARFPKYMDRTNGVIPVQDRINYCFTRSLAGTKIPADSKEMADIVAYLALISKGVPVGEHIKGEGLVKMPDLKGDSAVGQKLFTDNCVRCHGQDGNGMGPVPALWGKNSFSIGASTARLERAASFIQHNMPFDRPGTLTNQQAFDLAAYVTSHARPDSPGKENDYPAGNAPKDLPYDTKTFKSAKVIKVIPRTANPAGALVPAPVSIIHSR